MSVKYQIVLPNELAIALKRVSEKLKVPRAQIIREAIEAKLESYRKSSGSDPFAGITSLIESGESDISSRVDEILYK